MTQWATIENIRACVQKGTFSVTDHAITEGFHDGITVADMVNVLRTGKIIERYPKRSRCLVYGRKPDGLPIHVVVEFQPEYTVEIITTYIPRRDLWIKGQVRRKRKRQGE